ncbi:MAG TPA: hypothetical protein VN106_00775 [Sphingomicrobium sp.]|nr:hypothetical protein [Sphingomicrobium sp.]
MYHAPVSARPRQADGRRLLVVAAMLFALALLAFDAQAFLAAALRAIRYPFELDYGEGIVWQQAQQMGAGHAYGSITGFPTIVFHYPPLYHAITLVVAGVSGLDMLMAGRIVSVAATLLTAVFAALIAYRAVRGDIARKAAGLCGLIAGLVTLTVWPVTNWGPLMRVDMVAMALGLAGLWLSMLAFTRPRLVHLAALCFVAAVFAKQTAIAAPAAAFLTLLLLKPRTALAGIATSIAVGLAVLGLLTWATDGGFVRHIFLYNINRFDASRLAAIATVLARHEGYLAVVGIGLAKLHSKRQGPFSLRELRGHLAESQGAACLLLLLLYLAFAVLMMLTVAKVGSNINYFLEALCAVAILVGVACRDAAVAVTEGSAFEERGAVLLRIGLPLLIGVQALLVPPPLAAEVKPSRMAETWQLVQMIHDADRPVISDDMVLIKRAGREVVWEPAIFAELASKGIWDERPFIARVRRGEFAFFVTRGDRGGVLFQNRYTPAVADAMDAAYPVRRRMAGYVLHLPRDMAAPR